MSKFDVSAFLAEFFDEANSRLQLINQKLLLLEKTELDAAGLIQLRRDVHTIKGSAQMLGVQDVSEVCHLIEDVVDDVVASKSNPLPMIQFLFDLHDSLQHRLKHHDAKVRLDVALKQIKFEHLKQALASSDVPKQKITVVIPPIVKKKRLKKKSKISQSMIAAVMGSIEVSLEKKEDLDAVDSSEQQDERIVKKVIDFRPDLTALNIEDIGIEQGSGSFLRVDKGRLSELSNQIIELASLQLRHDTPEQQLQRIIHDFRHLKEKNLSDQHDNTSSRLAMQGAMDRYLRQIQQCGDLLRQQQLRSSQMLNGVRDQVLGLMLRPLHGVFSMFPRAVRDSAKRNGKKVQLLIAGEAVEMDQVSAEALSEPLMHLINNAISHGIETPDQRLACGKEAEGQITIHASQKGNLIHLDVCDDGRGLDVDAIKLTAIEHGLITATEADDMSKTEIHDLIFSPAFSTQSEVTELAGRGMGMSVVLDVMRELTGSIHAHSEAGKGTCFSMVFPVSLTVQQAQLVRVAKQRFIILSNLIVHMMPLKDQVIEKGSGVFKNGYIMYQGHRIAVIDLRHLLGAREERATSTSTVATKMLIVEHGEGFLAMLVDEVLDTTEIMVRDIDPYLKRYQPLGLMACSIIDDGTVQLILDPNGLKELMHLSRTIHEESGL